MVDIKLLALFVHNPFDERIFCLFENYLVNVADFRKHGLVRNVYCDNFLAAVLKRLTISHVIITSKQQSEGVVTAGA